MQTKKGFTLIELLVVVLIIGILAAVALPQYQLAVNKTRFANLRNIATSFIKASEAYYLANGDWPNNFEELAVDLPAGFTQNTVATYTCGKNAEMYCCVIKESGAADPAINCGNNEYTFSFYSMYTTNKRKNYCVAKDDNRKAKQLCKAMTDANGTSGWYLITPDGFQGGATGYRWYLF